jgi:hypothetical protein
MANCCFSCVIPISMTTFSIANNLRMYVLIRYFVFLCHFFSMSLYVFVFLYHKKPKLFFPSQCWDWFFACIHSDGNPCNNFVNNPSCSNPCKVLFLESASPVLFWFGVVLLLIWWNVGRSELLWIQTRFVLLLLFIQWFGLIHNYFEIETTSKDNPLIVFPIAWITAYT